MCVSTLSVRVCFVFIQVLFPPNVLKRVLLQLSSAKVPKGTAAYVCGGTVRYRNTVHVTVIEIVMAGNSNGN